MAQPLLGARYGTKDYKHTHACGEHTAPGLSLGRDYLLAGAGTVFHGVLMGDAWRMPYVYYRLLRPYAPLRPPMALPRPQPRGADALHTLPLALGMAGL